MNHKMAWEEMMSMIKMFKHLEELDGDDAQSLILSIEHLQSEIKEEECVA